MNSKSSPSHCYSTNAATSNFSGFYTLMSYTLKDSHDENLVSYEELITLISEFRVKNLKNVPWLYIHLTNLIYSIKLLYRVIKYHKKAIYIQAIPLIIIVISKYQLMIQSLSVYNPVIYYNWYG